MEYGQFVISNQCQYLIMIYAKLKDYVNQLEKTSTLPNKNEAVVLFENHNSVS